MWHPRGSLSSCSSPQACTGTQGPLPTGLPSPPPWCPYSGQAGFSSPEDVQRNTGAILTQPAAGPALSPGFLLGLWEVTELSYCWPWVPITPEFSLALPTACPALSCPASRLFKPVNWIFLSLGVSGAPKGRPRSLPVWEDRSLAHVRGPRMGWCFWHGAGLCLVPPITPIGHQAPGVFLVTAFFPPPSMATFRLHQELCPPTLNCSPCSWSCWFPWSHQSTGYRKSMVISKKCGFDHITSLTQMTFHCLPDQVQL